MNVRYLGLGTLLLALLSPAWGQTKIPLEERLWVASKIYASIPAYFAHWKPVSDLDLDAAYKEYLKGVIAADSRWDFDLLTKEFMARLKNGHTGFDDRFLDGAGGPPLGFSARPVDGKLTVTETFIDALKPGDVIERIDRVSMDSFFAAKRKYISASSDAAAQHVFFYHKHLFPQQFRILLASGAELSIDRSSQQLHFPESAVTEARWIEDLSIACIRIRSFEKAEYETFALNAVKQCQSARAILFDVRGNTGGGTPERLLRALIQRPYRNWGQASAVSEEGPCQGSWRMRQRVPLPERDLGYYSAFSEYFTLPQLVALGALIKPENPIYNGKVLVLTDFSCASACEDFVMPLKYSGRATIIGERTFGSSGQPFMYDFGNGMSFRVSSKRMYFPDGSEFEGVGIAPDVEVQPTIADRRAGKDAVFEGTLQLASGK